MMKLSQFFPPVRDFPSRENGRKYPGNGFPGHKGSSAAVFLCYSIPFLFALSNSYAGDWPEWGGDPTKNMVSTEAGAPVDFLPGEQMDTTEEIDMSTTQGVKWVAKLGSESYGNTTVGGGKVLAGTNNQVPRDPKHEGDRGVVYCFDESTGDFLWQLVVPKLEEGQVCDWEFVGICSSPTVDGTRVYVVTNRCEAICLDIDGLANGNDGPFKEEGQYMAGPGNPPMETGPTDADILWVFDMRDELGVFPHNIASSSILVVGDRLYVTTSNGQDWTHANTPFPLAPALVCLDKNTGELLGRERSGICERLYHCNWSSPAWGSMGDKEILVFGAGDGFCYGFDPVPQESEDGEGVLEEIWRYDCNPPHYKVKDGEPIQYMSPDGPSEICATPVYWKGRVYVGTGQDPENGTGVGILNCMDATAKGDVTNSGKVWSYEGINRTLSTASVADGLVFVGDVEGVVHCLDADTGEVYWVHDTGSQIWGSTLWVDGKVYAGNEDGILTILSGGKEKEVLKEIEFDAPIYSSPILANGVLYVSTQTHLYAIATPKK